MDNLASVNVVPFMGLLGLLEAKYLHLPEIFTTLIAILCDFNPVTQDNITRTKRYLSALLAREPELLQCLLTFLDEPQFILDPNIPQDTSSSTKDAADGQSWGDRQPEPASPHTRQSAPRSGVASHRDTPPSEGASSLHPGPSKDSAPEAGGHPDGENTAAGTTPSSAAGASGPGLHPQLAGARVDQLYVLRPQLVPLLNLPAGGLLGAEPLMLQTPCPHQRLALSTPLPCLIPTHFLPATCLTIPPPANPPGVGVVDPGLANMGAAFPAHQGAPFSAGVTKATCTTSTCPAGVPLHNQESRQTTVGTNTATIKTSLRGNADSKNQRSKSASSRQSADASPAMTSPASYVLSASTPPPASGKPATTTTTTSLSLSQLLGQPGVAPPGSYLDKHNCIIGGSNLLTSCAQKRPVVIATPGPRSGESKAHTEISKGLTSQAGLRASSLRPPVTATASRPASTTSCASKVAPILHSSEVFTSNSSSSGKPQPGSLSTDGKMHTVHVSLGSAQSLAAFPYIQEMVLPDPQAGTVALKLQTAGVEVTTSANHVSTFPPSVTASKPPRSSAATTHKAIPGATVADCAAKLQSLARASVHAKQAQKQPGGGGGGPPGPLYPFSAASSQVGDGVLSPLPDNPALPADDSRLPANKHDVFVPVAASSTGKVKVKRKRAASMGSSSPFTKPPAKQRNKENHL